MKREARKHWIELAVNATLAADAEGRDPVIGWPTYYLCSFCRYCEWGGSVPCESWVECHNPLPNVGAREFEPLYEPSDDCWGFNPRRGGFEKLALEAFNDFRIEQPTPVDNIKEEEK